MTKQRTLKLRYNGDTISNGMNPYIFSQSVTAFADYINSATRISAGENIEIDFKIHRVNEGSLELEFLLELTNHITEIKNVTGVIASVFETVKQGIELTKHLNGNPPTKRKQTGNTVEITNNTGEINIYIDCCGVLHHMPEPQAGFDALSEALAPHGGLGFMVYAPYGRAGVYPLQEAFGPLTEGMSPKERLAFGQDVFQRIPHNHLFKRNDLVGDHKVSEAGFYDLLLHSQDISCTIADVFGFLDKAGLELADFTQPALYSLNGLLPQNYNRPEALSRMDEMQLSEKLRGNMKTHVGYAHKAGRGMKSDPINPLNIPHFIGEDSKKAAAYITQRGGLPVAINGQKIGLGIPLAEAKLIALVDGKTTVSELQKKSGLGLDDFNVSWAKLSDLLSGYGLILYSILNKK